MKTPFSVIFAVCSILCFSVTPSAAGDLQDGISSFTEESISSEESLGQAETNINFIVVKAMADIKREQNKHKKTKDGKSANPVGKFNPGGDFNENSVIIGPGAKTGDITNVNIQGIGNN